MHVNPLRWFSDQSPRKRGRPRLTVEALEGRDCPALTLAFDAVTAYGGMVWITGSVEDDDGPVARAEVTFSGVVQQTVYTDSYGNIGIGASASSLGVVYGIASDSGGDQSAQVQDTLTDANPTIVRFSAMRLSGNTWVFYGRVADGDFTGMTVKFGGLPSLANVVHTVQSDGSFSAYVTLAAGETGEATVFATDYWSNDSDLAETYVSPA